MSAQKKMSAEERRQKEDDLGYAVYSEEEIKEMRERENFIIVDGKGTEKRVPTLAETVISKPPHQFGLTTFSEYLDKMQELSDFRIEQSLWRDRVEIEIETPYAWFGVQGFSDSHIGSHGTEYDTFKEILAGWLQHDNLRTILLGDLGDFFVPKGRHVEGMMGDVVTPQTQMVALKKFFTEYQDEILANTSEPSHGDWVYQTSGIDIYEYINHDLSVPLVNPGGAVLLNINGIKYDIMPFHDIAKFKSSYNLTHAGKQAIRFKRDADVAMSGHIHKDGAFEKGYFNEHEIVVVQCGTLLTREVGSAHMKKQGYVGNARPYYPIIVFNTQEKRMQVVDDLRDAELFLREKIEK